MQGSLPSRRRAGRVGHRRRAGGAVLVVTLGACGAPRVAPVTPGPFTFSGRALIVASDGDQVATAYADGRLGRVEGLADSLTIIDLPLHDRSVIARHALPIGSSVVGWPGMIAADTAFRSVFVVEARGRPAAGISQVARPAQGLPAGRRLMHIARRDTAFMTRVVDVGHNPAAVALAPGGDLLVVGTEDTTSALRFATLRDGAIEHSFEAVALPPDRATRPRVSALAWHPAGSHLAVIVDERLVRIARVERAGAGPSATIQVRWLGDALAPGRRLAGGRFTPDGRHLLVTDVATGGSPRDFLFNPPGQLVAIAIDTLAGAHRVSVRTEVGLVPEGLALTPDGRFAVTVNMRRTYLPRWRGPLPVGLWPGRAHASLTLVELALDRDAMRVVDEYGFPGLLPEQAVFDRDGATLAVAIYHDREPSPRRGAVEFWRLVRAPVARLERTALRVPVARGAHDLLLVP